MTVNSILVPGNFPVAFERLLGAETILAAASSEFVIAQAIDLLQRLEADDYSRFMNAYYVAGSKRFGPAWRYADILTVLLAATPFLKPRNYLEIGVRRGRSVAAVITHQREIPVYAFDMWVQNYAGMANPGAAFVEGELRKLGFRGEITFIDGNSHETLPRFFRDHPALELDLITVDGDHSLDGALQDLRDVLPYLAVGGVIVFDDIAHPAHPGLQQVWRDAVAEDAGIVASEFTDLGHGVALGVRARPSSIRLSSVDGASTGKRAGARGALWNRVRAAGLSAARRRFLAPK